MKVNRRIRIIIAGLIMIICLILVSQGMNHWVQAMGLVSAGFLFGNSI